jgi:hypothetical protein
MDQPESVSFNDPQDDDLVLELATWLDAKGLSSRGGAKLCFDFIIAALCARADTRDQLHSHADWLKQRIDERISQMHRRQ